MAAEYVLDAWPVMEWLFEKEPVAAMFKDLLVQVASGAALFCMSRINYGEVVYIVRKEQAWPSDRVEETLRQLGELPIEIVSATDRRVDEAVELKSRYNISYADAFAAALSIERKIPLVTGDKEFRKLEADGLLKLHWLGI